MSYEENYAKNLSWLAPCLPNQWYLSVCLSLAMHWVNSGIVISILHLPCRTSDLSWAGPMFTQPMIFVSMLIIGYALSQFRDCYFNIALALQDEWLVLGWPHVYPTNDICQYAYHWLCIESIQGLLFQYCTCPAGRVTCYYLIYMFWEMVT